MNIDYITCEMQKVAQGSHGWLIVDGEGSIPKLRINMHKYGHFIEDFGARHSDDWEKYITIRSVTYEFDTQFMITSDHQVMYWDTDTRRFDSVTTDAQAEARLKVIADRFNILDQQVSNLDKTIMVDKIKKL